MRLKHAAHFQQRVFVGGLGDERIGSGEHVASGCIEEQSLRLIARPTLGRGQLPQQLRRLHARKVRLTNRLVTLGRDAPDAAMRAVALRVGVAGLVVADDRIEPVGQIHAAIGPHADVHRAEGLAGGGHQLGQLFALEACAVIQDAMQLDDVAEVAADQGAALDVLRKRGGADDVDTVRLRVAEEQITHAVVFIGVRDVHHAWQAVVAIGAVTALVEELVVIVEDHAPAVVPGFSAIEVGFQLFGARVQAPYARFIKSGQTVRGLDARKRMKTLREPQAAVGSSGDTVGQADACHQCRSRRTAPSSHRPSHRHWCHADE